MMSKRYIGIIWNYKSWILSCTAAYIIIFHMFTKGDQTAEPEINMEQGVAWLNSRQWSPDNSRLIQIIKQLYLFPPSKEDYNLLVNKRNSSDGQGQLASLASILKGIKNGFFIECGAFDGEYLSNTLWLEKELGWSGLLIEPDPESFRVLKLKNRKAWHINVCLSRFTYPVQFEFHRHPVYAVLNKLGPREEENKTDVMTESPATKDSAIVKAQCISLYSILLAVNQTMVVDFFSLDVEGVELEILHTIPFDKITFKIITIESNLISATELNKFMTLKGFKVYKKIHVDTIFVNIQYWKELVGT